ncbi:MAG: Ultraviolet N-glycosylase/AP lyase [Firmicutes bacterium ADurb.Bin300]|jgi:endonuclease-3|nr:MAG: Ultraviolet N-glycosylase/AP lyase [Firmicutes bacterium ADurb.Bin300]
MSEKQRISKIIEALKKKYPEAICSLRADTPFELLVSTRLSAQCTDKRVNEITPALFNRYRTLEDYASADIVQIEELIRSCGFYHTKAKDIVNMAKMLIDEYGGIIPDSIEELIKLPGVGRKTANLIVGDLYNKPAVVCDTHVIRITNRLGLVNTKVPEKVEVQLKKILPAKESNDFCHRIVLHGRETCTARKARCGECVILQYCKYGKTEK